jgi:RNA polymerase sigma-70 factor (ECF subfamily)
MGREARRDKLATLLCDRRNGGVDSSPMNPSSRSGPYPSQTASESPPRAPTGSGASALMSETDLELIERMKMGDERALAVFYDRWCAPVNGLVARMLKPVSDVEDVVEETFWQAWRQADRFVEGRGSVQNWLLTIARSRALDRLRSIRRRGEESIDDVGPSGALSGMDPSLGLSASDPAHDAEQDDRRRFVLAALAELPNEQREALELGYFGGLSQSEIAERTGQPLGTIKTRMRLAMQKLRDRLSPLREVAG